MRRRINRFTIVTIVQIVKSEMAVAVNHYKFAEPCPNLASLYYRNDRSDSKVGNGLRFLGLNRR